MAVAELAAPLAEEPAPEAECEPEPEPPRLERLVWPDGVSRFYEPGPE